MTGSTVDRAPTPTISPEYILIGVMAVALMRKMRLSKKEKAALTDDVIATLEGLSALCAVTPLHRSAAALLHAANVREALEMVRVMGPVIRG